MSLLTNQEMRITYASLLVAGIFGMAALAPLVFFSGTLMEWGFAVMLISGFVAMAFCIAAVFYFFRALAYESIVGGKNLLAHWKYGKEEWRGFAESNYKYELDAKKSLLLLVAFFMFLIGGIFLIIDFEAGIFVAAVLVFVFILCAIATFALPWVNYRRNLGMEGEAYISKDGVLISSSLHMWNAFLTRFEECRVVENRQPLLEITYSAWARYSRQYETFNVPIPDGKLEEARKICKKLNAPQ